MYCLVYAFIPVYAFLTPSKAQCYFPNGSLAARYTPCSAEQETAGHYNHDDSHHDLCFSDGMLCPNTLATYIEDHAQTLPGEVPTVLIDVPTVSIVARILVREILTGLLLQGLVETKTTQLSLHFAILMTIIFAVVPAMMPSLATTPVKAFNGTMLLCSQTTTAILPPQRLRVVPARRPLPPQQRLAYRHRRRLLP